MALLVADLRAWYFVFNSLVSGSNTFMQGGEGQGSANPQADEQHALLQAGLGRDARDWGVARRYVTLLKQLPGAVPQQLEHFLSLLLKGLMMRPFVWQRFVWCLAPHEQETTIHDIADTAKLGREARGALTFLAQHQRLGLLPLLARVWREDHQTTVELTTAGVPTDLPKTPSTKGSKTVCVTQTQDTSLLAGHIAVCGTRRVDASLKTALARFRQNIVNEITTRHARSAPKGRKT